VRTLPADSLGTGNSSGLVLPRRRGDLDAHTGGRAKKTINKLADMILSSIDVFPCEILHDWVLAIDSTLQLVIEIEK
jgi:hypothetical protein